MLLFCLPPCQIIPGFDRRQIRVSCKLQRKWGRENRSSNGFKLVSTAKNGGNKVTPGVAEESSSVEEKFGSVVKHVEVLESDENSEYLRNYFAKFLDRMFLYFYVLMTTIVTLFAMLY